MKKTLPILLIVVIIAVTPLYGLTLESGCYRLKNSLTVGGGASSSSGNYRLRHAVIGGLFGGVSGSANYSINTSRSQLNIDSIPKAPTALPIQSPTNIIHHTLYGSKDPYTSLYINGLEVTPITPERSWSYSIDLDRGDTNYTYIILSKNRKGIESPAIELTLTLDTIPPIIVVDTPSNNSIVPTTPLGVTGSIDGIPFTRDDSLSYGINTITINQADPAGNVSEVNVEVYLVRAPLNTP